MKTLYTLLILIFIAMVFGWAYRLKTPPKVVMPEKKLTVTIYPVYDLVRQVAGNKFQVILITSIDADNTPAAQESSALFYINSDIDNFAIPFAQKANITTTIALNQSLPTTHPYYFLSLKNAQIITDTIAQNLINLDPDNADYYTQNAKDYKKKLQQLSATGQNYFQSDRNMNPIVLDDTFLPLYSDYGITPTYASNATISSELRDKTLHLTTTQLTPELEPLAVQYNVTLKPLDPYGGSIEHDTYLNTMEYNLKQLF